MHQALEVGGAAAAERSAELEAELGRLSMNQLCRRGEAAGLSNADFAAAEAAAAAAPPSARPTVAYAPNAYADRLCRCLSRRAGSLAADPKAALLALVLQAELAAAAVSCLIRAANIDCPPTWWP